MSNPSILVVDDEKNICRTLSMTLSDDYDVETALSAEEGLKKLESQPFDLLIVDHRMPGMKGLDMIREIRKRELPIEIIFVSGDAEMQDALIATKQLGAFSFIEKPFNSDEVLLMNVKNAIEHGKLSKRVQALETNEESAESTDERYSGMVGESEAMKSIREKVRVLGPTPAKVLILGESGVGKDLVARSIHALSDRAKRTFVKVNCSAIPSELIESELFGHEKGSFTGAANKKRGLFEMADGGTIFLDEVGDMSLAAQAKVLRVLQNGEFTRVGGEKLEKVDVRVIAATNKDLKKEAAKGLFRDDLYYRLETVIINVPPLRERLDDVPLLVNNFLTKIAAEYGRKPLEVTKQAMDALRCYSYPGNIRELHNICERFVIMCKEKVCLQDVPEEITDEIFASKLQTLTKTLHSLPVVKPVDANPGVVNAETPVKSNDPEIEVVKTWRVKPNEDGSSSAPVESEAGSEPSCEDNVAVMADPIVDGDFSVLANIVPGSMPLRDFRDLAEEIYIQATLKLNNGNISRTAEVLSIERTSLHRKLRKLNGEKDTD